MRLSPLVQAVVVALFLLAAPATANEVRIPNNGLKLNAELTLAGGKTLADGAVLIVHGTMAHNAMDTISNLAGVLNERGFNTLAINLSLGIDDRHGMYDCKVTHRHRHADALEEIGLWLDWLRGQGGGPVVLLGHSRGGNQAARFAAEHGHPLLRALVLLAPATWDEAATAKAYEAKNGKPLADALARAEAMVAAGKGDDVLPDAHMLYCETGPVTADSFLGYYKPDSRYDTPSIVGRSPVPTLVVAGSADSVVADLPRKMQGKADGERIVFKVVDGADHFFLDLFAEDIADLVEALPEAK